MLNLSLKLNLQKLAPEKFFWYITLNLNTLFRLSVITGRVSLKELMILA